MVDASQVWSEAYDFAKTVLDYSPNAASNYATARYYENRLAQEDEDNTPAN